MSCVARSLQSPTVVKREGSHGKRASEWGTPAFLLSGGVFHVGAKPAACVQYGPARARALAWRRLGPPPQVALSGRPDLYCVRVPKLRLSLVIADISFLQDASNQVAQVHISPQQNNPAGTCSKRQQWQHFQTDFWPAHSQKHPHVTLHPPAHRRSLVAQATAS